jgi:hypothetical protein
MHLGITIERDVDDQRATRRPQKSRRIIGGHVMTTKADVDDIGQVDGCVPKRLHHHLIIQRRCIVDQYINMPTLLADLLEHRFDLLASGPRSMW